MRRSRKPVWAVPSIEGSNPSLSAGFREVLETSNFGLPIARCSSPNRRANIGQLRPGLSTRLSTGLSTPTSVAPAPSRLLLYGPAGFAALERTGVPRLSQGRMGSNWSRILATCRASAARVRPTGKPQSTKMISPWSLPSRIVTKGSRPTGSTYTRANSSPFRWTRPPAILISPIRPASALLPNWIGWGPTDTSWNGVDHSMLVAIR
jgi:hypothetical protein